MNTKRWSQRIGWGVMAFLAVGIAIASAAPYLTFNPDNFADIFDGRFQDWTRTFIYVHAFSSAIALLTGPMQFVRWFRNRYLRVHHLVGRVYMVCIVVGALSGLAIAPGTPAGVSGTIGFSMLAVLWLVTVSFAFNAIRRGRVQEHREWMIRNYALTFAAVTLRLYLGIGIALLLPQLEATFNGDMEALFNVPYSVVPWLSWVPNIIVAEIIVNRTRPTQRTTPVRRREMVAAAD